MPAFEFDVRGPTTPRLQYTGFANDISEFDAAIASDGLQFERCADMGQCDVPLMPEVVAEIDPPVVQSPSGVKPPEDMSFRSAFDEQAGMISLNRKLDYMIAQLEKNLSFTRALYKTAKRPSLGAQRPSLGPSPLQSFWKNATARDAPILKTVGSMVSCESKVPNQQRDEPANPANIGRGSTLPKADQVGSPANSGIQEHQVDRSRWQESDAIHNIDWQSDGTRSISTRRRRKSRWQEFDTMLSKRRSKLNRASFAAWRFMSDESSSPAAAAYSFVHNSFVILAFVLSFINIADVDSSGVFVFSRDHKMAWTVQIIIEVIFALELTLRFAVCPYKTVFCLNLYNIIDALTVIPVFVRVLIIVMSSSRDDVIHTEEVIAFLCFVPVMRLLKLLRHFETFQLLLASFNAAGKALPVLMFTELLICMVFAAIVFYVEPRSNIPTIPESLYFVVVTLSTVGYGDYSPTTFGGKLTCNLLMCIGPLYLAIPIGIVGTAFSHAWEDRHRLLLIHRLRSCFAKAGYTPTDVCELYSKIFDRDGNGTLDYCEFGAMIRRMQVGVDEKHIAEVFRNFDFDDEGTIDIRELIRGLFPKTHWLANEYMLTMYGGKLESLDTDVVATV